MKIYSKVVVNVTINSLIKLSCGIFDKFSVNRVILFFILVSQILYENLNSVYFRESEARCPVDNQALEERQLFPDNFAKREILALTVKCPNHTKGCDQTVVLKHLQVSILIHIFIYFFYLNLNLLNFLNEIFFGTVHYHFYGLDVGQPTA